MFKPKSRSKSKLLQKICRPSVYYLARDIGGKHVAKNVRPCQLLLKTRGFCLNWRSYSAIKGVISSTRGLIETI